jgi:hypothetical protein
MVSVELDKRGTDLESDLRKHAGFDSAEPENTDLHVALGRRDRNGNRAVRVHGRGCCGHREERDY